MREMHWYWPQKFCSDENNIIRHVLINMFTLFSSYAPLFPLLIFPQLSTFLNSLYLLLSFSFSALRPSTPPLYSSFLFTPVNVFAVLLFSLTLSSKTQPICYYFFFLTLILSSHPLSLLSSHTLFLLSWHWWRHHWKVLFRNTGFMRDMHLTKPQKVCSDENNIIPYNHNQVISNPIKSVGMNFLG